MASILVFDANQRSALAVVRSLGCQGHKVYVSDCTEISLSGQSKHCFRYLRSPNPVSAITDFIQWLGVVITEEQIDLLLPVTDISTQILLNNQQSLPSSCIIPYSELDILTSLSDKIELAHQAAKVNIPCPEYHVYENAKSLVMGSIDSFPIVLKPARSVFIKEDDCVLTSVSIVNSAEELQNVLKETSYLDSFPFMIQKYVPGHGAGVFALYNQGKAVAFFAHQRLREKPPRGGVSVLSESVELDAELLSMTRKLLDSVNWHGVAMVEFRIDPSGKPWLMEVNTRFWGSLQLAIDAGVNFPLMLCKIALGETAENLNYKKGQRLRWLLGDVDSLYLYLRDSEFSLKEKLLKLIQFLTPMPWCTRHEVNRWDDMGPAWFELNQYWKQIFNR